jgi:Sulfotransferase domain.
MRRILKETRQELREAKQQLGRANRRLAKANERNAALRTRLARMEAGHEVEGIQPERIVWVFGSGRTGSTWLSGMMQALPDHARWNEPNVGHLFGHLYYQRSLEGREDQDNFILASGFRETWLSSIRGLVLNGANTRFAELAQRRGYLVIKEPHGSIGAPLLIEALPESRMVFLVRDPRDVAASALHTRLEGARAPIARADRMTMPAENPNLFAISRAEAYLQHIGHAKQAYEAHEGRKVLIRYEDLKANTLETMKRLYATLDIPVEDEELQHAVEKYASENIPEHKKGYGTVRRRATSGGWREDLTPKQAELVESITAPLLEEYYGLVPKAPATARVDIEALRRAYLQRDVDSVLSFYADDARLRIINRFHPPSTPYELHGKEQITRYQRRIFFKRDMKQRLEPEVVGEDEIAFRVVREYPSEGRLLSEVVLQLSEEGKIVWHLEEQEWGE